MNHLTFENPENLRVLFFLYTDLRVNEPTQFFYAGELFESDPNGQLFAFQEMPLGKLKDGTYCNRCVIESHDLNSAEKGLFLVTLYLTSFPVSAQLNAQLQFALADSVHADIKEGKFSLLPRKPTPAVFGAN
jgi:hypothetical protein